MAISSLFSGFLDDASKFPGFHFLEFLSNGVDRPQARPPWHAMKFERPQSAENGSGNFERDRRLPRQFDPSPINPGGRLAEISYIC